MGAGAAGLIAARMFHVPLFLTLLWRCSELCTAPGSMAPAAAQAVAAQARARAHFHQVGRPHRAQALLAGARQRASAPSLANGGAVEPLTWLTLTDFNVSTDGSSDVSAAIDAIGKAHTHGVILVVPGDVSAADAGAGFPTARYLVNPPSRVWNSPPSLTLWLEPGAVLVSGPGVRTYLGGPLRVGGHQIFDPTSHPTKVQIQSNGTNATVLLPHGSLPLRVGDRFGISGAAQAHFNGFFAAFSVAVTPDGRPAISYQMASQPDPHDRLAQAGGAPVLTFASFYFGQQKPNRVLVGNQMSPVSWCSPEWWGAVAADSGVDSTAAVQFALDSGHPVTFLSDYRVSRVTVGAGTVLDGQGHALLGAAKTATNAVLEVKGDMCDIRDLQVHSDFGAQYASAVHWYKLRLALFHLSPSCS